MRSIQPVNAFSTFIDLSTPEPQLISDLSRMVMLEEDILEAKDPSIKDIDEWPTFALRKVSVISTRNGKQTSLLEAHQDNPVKVSGQLEPIAKDQIHLGTNEPSPTAVIQLISCSVKDDRYRTKTIELSNVVSYAFAEYDDGTFGFWAAGKAGWFEIRSASGPYQQTFANMNEASAMFYIMVDKTKRGRKDPSKMSIKDLNRYGNGLAKDVCCLIVALSPRFGTY